MADAIDYEHMARALQLAANGLYDTAPNPAVGCVLVRDARVVGTGWTAPAGGPHAEIVALKAAGAADRATAAALALQSAERDLVVATQTGNDDALLRWNACARIIMGNQLSARTEEKVELQSE